MQDDKTDKVGVHTLGHATTQTDPHSEAAEAEGRSQSRCECVPPTEVISMHVTQLSFRMPATNPQGINACLGHARSQVSFSMGPILAVCPGLRGLGVV